MQGKPSLERVERVKLASGLADVHAFKAHVAQDYGQHRHNCPFVRTKSLGHSYDFFENVKYSFHVITY